MNQRTQRLDTIRTLARTAERESARVLAERRNILDKEEQRLEQLQAYLREYADLSTAPSATGMFIDTIRTRRQFVDKVRQGLAQQERVVAGVRQQLDQDMQRWRDARSRSLAMERFTERLDEQEAVRQGRREQAALDEVGRSMFQRA